MSKYSNLRRFAAIGALSLMAATQASAHSLAAVTAAGNFTFAAGTATLPGMTTPLFFNPAGARFIATFSSECSVNAAAGNSNAYTDVDIVVLNPANVVWLSCHPRPAIKTRSVPPTARRASTVSRATRCRPSAGPTWLPVTIECRCVPGPTPVPPAAGLAKGR